MLLGEIIYLTHLLQAKIFSDQRQYLPLTIIIFVEKCYPFLFIHNLFLLSLIMFGSVPLIQSVCCLLVAS